MLMFKTLINPKTYLLVLGLAAPCTAAPATASAASTAPTAATGAKTSAKTSSTTGVVRHLLHDKKTTKTFSYLSPKIRTSVLRDTSIAAIFIQANYKYFHLYSNSLLNRSGILI